MIEQRLQTKLRNETDSVRRAEEAKKDKTLANRKEEELQLMDSIVRVYSLFVNDEAIHGYLSLQHKLRRTRSPLISHFLLTSDIIPPPGDSPPQPSKTILSLPPRSNPPPLFYLPGILLPSQEAFLSRRETEVSEREFRCSFFSNMADSR